MIYKSKGREITSITENFTVVDLETTGFNPLKNKIIEIAAIRIRNREIDDIFHSYINPQIQISPIITNITGIDNNLVEAEPTIDDVICDFLDFVDEDIILGHNVTFDISFLFNAAWEFAGVEFNNDYIDTLTWSRKMLPNLYNHRLSTIANYLGIKGRQDHSALSDCKTTMQVYSFMAKKIVERNKR